MEEFEKRIDKLKEQLSRGEKIVWPEDPQYTYRDYLGLTFTEVDILRSEWPRGDMAFYSSDGSLVGRKPIWVPNGLDHDLYEPVWRTHDLVGYSYYRIKNGIHEEVTNLESAVYAKELETQLTEMKRAKYDLEKLYNTNSDKHLRVLAGKALGYSKVRIFIHELFK